MSELDAILPEADGEEDLEGLDIPDENEATDLDGALAKMQWNLNALEEKVGVVYLSRPRVTHTQLRRNVESRDEGEGSGEEVVGWRKAEDWRPCPIGMWA